MDSNVNVSNEIGNKMFPRTCNSRNSTRNLGSYRKLVLDWPPIKLAHRIFHYSPLKRNADISCRESRVIEETYSTRLGKVRSSSFQLRAW